MSLFQEFTTQASLYFGDGRVFFLGCFLSILGVAGSGRFKSKWSRAFDYFAWLGMLLVFISATPLPSGVYALWLSAFLFAVLGPRFSKFKISPKVILPCFAAFTLLIGGLEARHHLMPTLSIPHDKPIYILGDSISAGVGGPETTWPEVWAQQSGREVIYLAVPGAKVADAIERQSQGIDRKNSTVIVEIGGNDLMGATTSAEFEHRLASLLSQLKQNQHQVIMFELPLLPLSNRFGSSQRVLAKEFGVTLIPKRFLVDVFETRGATLDGLHLSQVGHDKMARRIQEITGTKP